MSDSSHYLDLAALRQATHDDFWGSSEEQTKARRYVFDQLPAILATLERAEGIEAAAREVQHEIMRNLSLGQVPQLPQIQCWRDRIAVGLRDSDDG